MRDVSQIIDEMTAEIRRLRRWSDHIHRDLDVPAFDLDRLAAVKKRLDEMRPWLSAFDPRDADLARHQRALAAGPAHIRAQVHVEPNTREAYARAVESAQRRAMEEG